MPRILLLGGTSEAAEMARILAGSGLMATYSYAGRTSAPMVQPLPMRVGGFGGIEGLRDYLRRGAISHVIDATHPFAARISANAVAACHAENIALCALERLPWVAQKGDNWTCVPDMEAAALALPEAAARVFLAVGRQQIGAFACAPQHHYLLRMIEPPALMPLPKADLVLARGPFDEGEDMELMVQHRIERLVAKNAGGSAARAKIDAARRLRVPVIMIDRPRIGAREVFHQAEEVMGWLGHARSRKPA